MQIYKRTHVESELSTYPAESVVAVVYCCKAHRGKRDNIKRLSIMQFVPEHLCRCTAHSLPSLEQKKEGTRDKK